MNKYYVGQRLIATTRYVKEGQQPTIEKRCGHITIIEDAPLTYRYDNLDITVTTVESVIDECFLFMECDEVSSGFDQ